MAKPLQKIDRVKPQQSSSQDDSSDSDDRVDLPPDKVSSGSQIRPFFSFSSFLLQSDNPQIFEWIFKREIGKGAMSHVFLAQNAQTQVFVAAKVYNKGTLLRLTLGNDEPPFVSVQREIEIMAAMTHRYVLPIIEVIEDECSNSLIMIMPFAEYGTLQEYIATTEIPEEQFATCFHQIAEALRYVHSLNIVHRDIKPENVLVFTDTFYVLSDFSVSSALTNSDETLSDTRGSPAFLSPEECIGDRFFPKPADVWAYGVSLYSCIFGSLPFHLDLCKGQTAVNTIYSVTQILKTGTLEFPADKEISPELHDLLTSILDKDYSKRPSFEQIVKHDWFREARVIDLKNIEDEKLDEEEARKDEEEESKLRVHN